ncbi:MAG: glycosyltransferase family 39 protein, partial [Nanoarchaeota archaeon]|nr:glycosyltransferase family 39 protein [Nanoarchaeota archaeon]
MHNLYYDEVAYLDIAKNIVEDTNNCLCLQNQDGTCSFCGYSLKSVGFSFFLALFFKIFWISKGLAFNLVAIIGSLSVVFMFFFAYFLFKKESLALLASAILAFYPLHMRWSGSVSAEIVALFFILLSFCCLFIFLKKQNIVFFLAFIFTSIFTVTIKEENILILPFLLIPFFYKKSLRNKALIISGIFLLLFLPYMLGTLFFHASSDVFEEGSRYTFWKGGQLFSWNFLEENFFGNFYFFADWAYTSIFVLIFLLTGLFFLFKDDKKLLLLFLSGILLVILLFSAYTGKPLIFSEVRHYIPILIPVIMISSYGMYKLIVLFKKDNLLYIFLLLIAGSTFFSIDYLISDNASVISAEEDYKTLLESLEFVPEGCIVLTQESYLLDFYDKSAASIFIPDLKLDGCIFYYEGELCYRVEGMVKCSQIIEAVPLEQIYTDGRHKLYKVNQESLDLDEIFASQPKL